MPSWTDSIAKNEVQAWSDLVSFRPPKAVQTKVNGFQKTLNFVMGGVTRVQHLENAYGRINL